MKAFPAQLAFMIATTPVRRNVAQLLRLLGVLAVLITFYSISFHYLMGYEGRAGEFSWFTGFYWTMTVMSTLGFGDITFQTDLGRAFAMIVLVSGLVSLLIIFPFTFIQFFWAPWLEAQRNTQAPRILPASTRDHVIITSFDAVSEALQRKLEQHGIPYVVLVPTVDEALELHDRGYRVMIGQPDSPDTYHRARVENAAMVIATASDEINTNVAFTVREISGEVPVVVVANRKASDDVLELAGSSHVLLLGELLGQSLARRAGGGDAVVHPVGGFGQVAIAEVVIGRTPMANVRVRECQLRERYGVTIAGLWDRGQFRVPRAEHVLGPDTVALLVGSPEELKTLNDDLVHPQQDQGSGLVLVIGGGRVGRAAAESLRERGTPYRVLEHDPAQVAAGDEHFVLGDASELEDLQRAGLDEAISAIITTQDDDTNIYLTIYCRRLRPDLQIVSRATHERNIATLHRAGADFVMSYASLGADTIFNYLSRGDTLMVSEGLHLMRTTTPAELVGRSIADSGLRSRTGYSIVAVTQAGQTVVSPPPETILEKDAMLLLMGTVEAEGEFLRVFARQKGSRHSRGRRAREA